MQLWFACSFVCSFSYISPVHLCWFSLLPQMLLFVPIYWLYMRLLDSYFPRSKMWMLKIIVCWFVWPVGSPLPRSKMQMLQMIVCLTSRFLPPSLDFYFPKMQDVDVAMIVCWFVWSICLFDQDARCGFCNHCLSDQCTDILVGS